MVGIVGAVPSSLLQGWAAYHPAALSSGHCLLHRIPFYQTEAMPLGHYTTPAALLGSQSQSLSGIRNLRHVSLPRGGANCMVQVMPQQSLGPG